MNNQFDTPVNLKNVTLVEDDPMMRKNLELLLTYFGLEVQNSHEQVDDSLYQSASKSDLILLDVNLPGKCNGVEFAEKYSKSYKTPIIFITGNSDPKVFEKACSSNVYAFLNKPFTIDQLNHALKITDLRCGYENQIVNYQKKLGEKEKSAQIGEYAGSIIHDLNNFTMIISTSFSKIDALISSYQKESGKLDFDPILKYVGFGKKATNRIVELSSRYRKLFFGDKNEKPVEININSFLDELHGYFNDRLQKADIQLTTEVFGAYKFISKEVVLLQALTNLISNSIFEILDKNLNQRWIKVEARHLGDTLEILVKDSGLGISRENASKLFDHGFTTKSNSDFEGSGVGLSYVKENIEKHLKGKIRLKSNEKNTTFQIIIPLLKIDEPQS